MFGGFPFGSGWFGDSPAAPASGDITGTGAATASAGQSAALGNIEVESSGIGTIVALGLIKRRIRKTSPPKPISGSAEALAAPGIGSGLGRVTPPVRASIRSVAVQPHARGRGGVLLPNVGRALCATGRKPVCRGAGAIDAGPSEAELALLLTLLD